MFIAIKNDFVQYMLFLRDSLHMLSNLVLSNHKPDSWLSNLAVLSPNSATQENSPYYGDINRNALSTSCSHAGWSLKGTVL